MPDVLDNSVSDRVAQKISFKDEKKNIAIAKTPGNRKKRKAIETLPLDWWIRCIANQIYIESYSLCGKELPGDQHSCAAVHGLPRRIRCSDPQGSGRGRETINPAKMKLCPGCHNAFASGKLYKCLQRL